MARNSKIYLCKDIHVDNTYQHVLNYTVQQMLELCTDPSHLVTQNSNYSFIRESENTISVGFTYAQCLESNYIAFQNSDYSNKWFFGWIRDVKYVSDGTTQITYDVDAWSTWFNDLTLKRSFVIREHVNDDTIGKHTLPESFETGEFIVNENPIDYCSQYEPNELGELVPRMSIIFGCTNLPKQMTNRGEAVNIDNYRSINSIYGGLIYLVATDPSMAGNYIEQFAGAGHLDYIQTMFMIPTRFIEFIPSGSASIDSRYVEFLWLGTQDSVRVLKNANDVLYHYRGAFKIENDANISINTTINGYTPKNNKLFVAPWNYMIMSNNSGSDVELHYEDFINNNPKFSFYGSITPGGSSKCVPLNYKLLQDSGNYNSYNFGITGGKFPICSWTGDEFINWLTQNGVNIAVSTITGLASLGVGIATGGVGLAVGAVALGNNIANTASQIYTRSKIPESTKGNLNSGDVTWSMGKSCFTLYKMCVKQEYAKMIDSYWSKFGYLVNALKVPNITGRRYWNYIQISNDDVLGVGSIPTKYMDIINQIAHKGVTIWHDHSNIGDYNLNNTII